VELTSFPLPNPAITHALTVGVRPAVEAVTHLGVMLAQAEVAKRTGRLAATARGEVGIGGVRNDRVVGHVILGGQGARGTVDYAASEQFGHRQDGSERFVEGARDLNRVLEQLRHL
jgi:hypothetical protein